MSKSFQVVRLGDLLIPISRSETVVPEKIYQILGAHWYANGLYTKDIRSGSQIKAKNLYRVEQGDFVYNRLFAWKGSFAIASEENHGCYVSNEFPCFLVSQGRIDGRYLWRYFSREGVWAEALGLSAGGTPTSRNRLKEDKLLAMKIPVPPLEEQRLIVVKIDELVSKIGEAHRLCHDATQGVAALFASASRTAFKPKPHWSRARVGDFCEMPQYGYTESATTEPLGPRFLRITDIQNGRVNWDKVPYCSCPNPQPYLLEEGDILFARTGATTGKSFLIRSCPEAVFASYLIRLRVRNTVTPEYLYQYFQSPSYWTQVIEEKKGTGQPNVNGKKLANIQVPIPPRAEQEQIVAGLDALQAKVDALRQLQAETVAELDALLPSILDKAFKGEL